MLVQPARRFFCYLSLTWLTFLPCSTGTLDQKEFDRYTRSLKVSFHTASPIERIFSYLFEPRRACGKYVVRKVKPRPPPPVPPAPTFKLLKLKIPKHCHPGTDHDFKIYDGRLARVRLPLDCKPGNNGAKGHVLFKVPEMPRKTPPPPRNDPNVPWGSFFSKFTPEHRFVQNWSSLHPFH